MENEKHIQVYNSLNKLVPVDKNNELLEKLKRADDEKLDELIAFKPKKTKTSVLLSVFLGFFGGDRYYVGNKIVGTIKLIITVTALVLMAIFGVQFLNLITTSTDSLVGDFTTSFFGTILFSIGLFSGAAFLAVMFIWVIIDAFLCVKKCKAVNFERIMEILE